MTSELEELKKKRLQVSIRDELVSWMDSKIDKAEFASYSHAIEYALLQLKEKKG